MRSIWRAEICEPIWRGRIQRIARAAASARARPGRPRTRSWMSSCTSRRDPALHISPLLPKMPQKRGLHRRVEIGIGEDDIGRLAAQFQAQALQVRHGRVLQQLARRRDAAGEADLVHVLVQRERLARSLAVSVTTFSDAFGQPRLARRSPRTAARSAASAPTASAPPSSRTPAPAPPSTPRSAAENSTARSRPTTPTGSRSV